MQTKTIIRQCKIELLYAEHELNEGRPDKAYSHLCTIYRFIHYGAVAVAYRNKNPKPPNRGKRSRPKHKT